MDMIHEWIMMNTLGQTANFQSDSCLVLRCKRIYYGTVWLLSVYRYWLVLQNITQLVAQRVEHCHCVFVYLI